MYSVNLLESWTELREKKGLDEGSHQVETSFTELHKRYDQMRQLMVAVWQRGKSLTQHNQELQAKIQEIKAEFQSKLTRSYEETHESLHSFW
ncbi:hypothetical protein EB796_015843 [Bugula neritina]|uniref:Uncharacterized protein n=1 Tax=Bugula neritina TaxID=10212 RepID=A0A7J7JK35_BUGNE|nr:hypothetical protein EB796_015843 [Bugula neritina]